MAKSKILSQSCYIIRIRGNIRRFWHKTALSSGQVRDFLVKKFRVSLQSLTKDSHILTVSNISSKVTGLVATSFIESFHGLAKRKFVQMVQDKLPTWLPCPYMYTVKPCENIFHNQLTHCLNNWYTASSATKIAQIMIFG